MSTITTKDGTTIYDKDWGKGPVVTLSHGWPLSSDMWDAVSHQLRGNDGANRSSGLEQRARHVEQYSRDLHSYRRVRGNSVSWICVAETSGAIRFRDVGGDLIRALRRRTRPRMDHARIVDRISHGIHLCVWIRHGNRPQVFTIAVGADHRAQPE